MKRIISVIMLLVVLAGCLCLTACDAKADKAVREQNLKQMESMGVFTYSFPSEKSLRQYYDDVKPSSYVIIRSNADGRHIVDAKISSGKKLNEAWTEEDIRNIDVVVVADSTYESEKYRPTNGGSIVNISSESVDLYYYDCREKEYVAMETIEGHKLPKTKESASSYTIGDKKVIQKAKETLGVPFFRTFYLFLLIGLVVVIVMVIVATIQNKREHGAPGAKDKSRLENSAYVLTVIQPRIFVTTRYNLCSLSTGHERISVGDNVIVMNAAGKTRVSSAKIAGIRQSDEKVVACITVGSSASEAYIWLGGMDRAYVPVAGDMIVKEKE